MAMVTCGTLLAGPARHALLEKSRNALLRILRERIHRHHFLGVGVSLGLIQIDLRIERLLAESHGEAAGVGDMAGELASLRFQFCLRHRAINKTPITSSSCIHRPSA